MLDTCVMLLCIRDSPFNSYLQLYPHYLSAHDFRLHVAHQRLSCDDDCCTSLKCGVEGLGSSQLPPLHPLFNLRGRPSVTKVVKVTIHFNEEIIKKQLHFWKDFAFPRLNFDPGWKRLNQHWVFWCGLLCLLHVNAYHIGIVVQIWELETFSCEKYTEFMCMPT